ncbi:MAG: hypothetical protein ABIJ57_07200 [Pseudomonadota bacterium]
MVENEDALKIFLATHYQLLIGPGGPIEINQVAVHEAMRLYRVRQRRACFEKVMVLSRWWIDRLKQKE